jgi:cysteine desulfurase/selenocysteine lyase
MMYRTFFPALEQKVNGHQLVYLDSAASCLKPFVVADRVRKYLAYEAANIHRGSHYLGNQGTLFYENTRGHVAQFIGAKAEEIIFVRGTTEAINLAAQSWGRSFLKPGDEVLLTELEHHANIVPWQMIAEQMGAKIQVAKIFDDGQLDIEDVKKKLNPKTKMFAFTACSNSLGTKTPVRDLVQLAKSVGSATLVDAAQMVSQEKISVEDWGADFVAFSAHKMFGPYGVGVLFIRHQLMDKLPPYQGGGSMIDRVTFAKTTYQSGPFRFEAGTPNVEGVVGLDAALTFLESFDWQEVKAHEQRLLEAATLGLQKIQGLRILGPSSNKAAILSFVVEGLHHADIGDILDKQGIAVRAGHHCTQPLMDRLGISGTVRASFSVFNSEEDCEKLVDGVRKAVEILA